MWINPDSSSEKTRHSGEGRNPVDKQIPTQVGQHLGFVCFAVYFLSLDSGFRRNDGLMDNLG
jgi:hypothetical protein